MNNRKSRMYVDGTAALKIDRSRSSRNVVRLGRAQDGSLVVARKGFEGQGSRGASSRVRPSARAEQNPSSLRDDLRVAFNAMGFEEMERNLFEGSVASRTFTNVGVLPVVVSSAAAFVITALMLMA